MKIKCQCINCQNIQWIEVYDEDITETGTECDNCGFYINSKEDKLED